MNLLVVDDDPDMRELLTTVLVRDRHQVDTAADGEEALDMARVKPFDVILTDVQLPKLTGLELFDKLRAEQPGTEVIVMTANVTLKDAVNALREGAADYLQKPFDMNELLIRVKRIGDRLELTRDLSHTRLALTERIGSYKLEEQIGEGAMGKVYRASHVMLRRPTAVKLLLRATSPSAISRFEREVQLSCRLTHPSTIAIYDYGRTLEGVFFYAMELLNGASLSQVVRMHGPLAPARAARLLVQLCGSLEEAHRLGMVHRDVKPSNIQLCERGLVHDTAKLLDFGLVKEVTEIDTEVTQEHVILGTPSYLAPEVIRDGAASSPAQDIYALGCVAYYMLAGKAAFFAPRPMDVYLMHLKDKPAPLKKVPPRLAKIVMRCLEKKPERRPSSALEVAQEIAALKLKWTDADAESWWKSHPLRAEVFDPTSGKTSPPE